MILSVVNFNLDNRCNSRCSHCVSSATINSQSRLAYETAVLYANQIGNISHVNTVQFSGGEPFLFLDLIDVIITGVTSQHQKTIKVSTGAAEFSSEKKTRGLLERLRSVNEIWVSIDHYHLEHVPVENYRVFDRVAKYYNLKIGYSICFNSLKELAKTLDLIKSENFQYFKILKQPILSHGRASMIENITCHEGNEIPSDYRCPETDFINIWPDGSVTNCGAYAGRSGFAPKSRNLTEFFIRNANDLFYQDRCNLTLSGIAHKHNRNGPFDITSPCATCRFLINGGLSYSS